MRRRSRDRKRTNRERIGKDGRRWKTYRINITKQHISQSITAFVATKPHLHNRGSLVGPGHGDGSAALHDDGGVWTRLEDGRDHVVDVGWQAHILAILAFDFVVALAVSGCVSMSSFSASSSSSSSPPKTKKRRELQNSHSTQQL